jgi:hypothetical protein
MRRKAAAKPTKLDTVLSDGLQQPGQRQEAWLSNTSDRVSDEAEALELGPIQQPSSAEPAPRRSKGGSGGQPRSSRKARDASDMGSDEDDNSSDSEGEVEAPAKPPQAMPVGDVPPGMVRS